MELDRKLLSRIGELDNDTLADTIGRIAAGFGIDPALASVYLGDMDKIKRSVTELTQEDFDRITAALGEEETEKLVGRIRAEVQS
ncbi:MAG: hypothetical protein IJC84_00810 [Clostridia bacterium]|nr:hypothetical protein [Clostridia bacterium]